MTSTKFEARLGQALSDYRDSQHRPVAIHRRDPHGFRTFPLPPNTERTKEIVQDGPARFS